MPRRQQDTAWELCPLGKVRPHKEQLLDLFKQHRAANMVALDESHLRSVEDAGTE
jgi:thymidylate synthase (FAD)